MRWIKPNLKSIYGLLGQPAPQASSSVEIKTEIVRQTMLRLLLEGELADGNPTLVRRVQFAGDIQGLWYARSDLMSVLASERGEAEAVKSIAVLSRLFEGLMPDAMIGQQSFRPRR